jgi:hypothetical protein
MEFRERFFPDKFQGESYKMKIGNTRFTTEKRGSIMNNTWNQKVANGYTLSRTGKAPKEIPVDNLSFVSVSESRHGRL